MRLRKTLILATTATAVIASTGIVAVTTATADPATAGTFNSVRASRIVDTRSGIGAPKAALAAHATLTFNATATLGSEPVSAVALTVTAVNPVKAGFLTVFPGGTALPTVSNVNFQAGRNIPNVAVVRVGANGTVSVYNGSVGTVNVLADLTGFWTGGTVDPGTAGALNVVAPTRLVDTRLPGGHPLAPMTGVVVPVAGHALVPTTNVSAVVINLTAAGPAAAGFLTAAAELQTPGTGTSSLNFAAGQTRANLVLVPLNPDGTITIYNGPNKPVNFVIDVFGYFNDGTPVDDGAFVPSTPYRALDTRKTGVPVPALTTAKIALLPDDGSSAIFKDIIVNVTVTNTQSAGFLTVWDGNGVLPPTSNSNFAAGESAAGTMLVPVNVDGTISVYNGSFGNVDLVIDVAGFVLNDLTALPVAVAKARAATAISHARLSRPRVALSHTK